MAPGHNSWRMAAALSDVKARRITGRGYRPLRRLVLMTVALMICWLVIVLAVVGAFALATSVQWAGQVSLQNQLGRAQPADAAAGAGLTHGIFEQANYKNAGSALALGSQL